MFKTSAFKDDKCFEELYILNNIYSDFLEKLKTTGVYNPERVKYFSSIEAKDIFFNDICNNNQNGLSCKGKRK